MDFELVAGGSASLVILGLIQVFKSFGMGKKYSPIVAIFLGLVFSFALAYFGENVNYEAAIKGLITGLSAVGIFSGTKNIIEAIPNKE